MQAVARSRPLPHWLTVPLIAFVVTRAVVFAGAYLSDIILPQVANEEPRGIVGVWNRWDTIWYADIVENGYNYSVTEKSSVAFFPLYPLLIAVLTPILRDPVAAGLLVSNLAFLGALILLYRLTEAKMENRASAARTVFYIAAFPTAFFFAAAYTESLFLLLSVAAAYYAHQRQWGWAVVVGALAAATRSLGFLVWLIVVYEWLSSHGWILTAARTPEAWRNLRAALRSDWPALLLICLIPLGLLAYMLYLALTFNDPVAFWSAQAAWGFESSNPLSVILRDVGRVARGELPLFTYLNILTFFVVLCLTIPIGRRLGAGYAAYTLLSVLIPMFSRAESLIRYILVLFPLFMLLGRWGRVRPLDLALRIIWLPFLALFTALFVKGVFIG